MRVACLINLLVIFALCETPTPLTATVDASASLTATVGSRVQLLVRVTNTGRLIPHLGLVFQSADKWYERHDVSDLGGCTIAPAQSAFDCGDLKPGQSAAFSITGVAKDAGNFHYEMALRELVQPYDFVNDHPSGADLQSWDESIAAAAT